MFVVAGKEQDMIQFKKVQYEMDGKTILRDISFSVQGGEFLSIIGHNGSGKTTLIKHINGLILPTGGKVSVDGLDTKENGREIRRKVGMVFQNPQDQLISSIVEDDVAFGLENLSVAPIEIRMRVDRILHELDITSLSKTNVNELSFGQKQLVALAGIIVMEPSYIIFDEPFSWLDPRRKAILKTIIQGLHRDGKTIILITNDPLQDAGAERTMEGRILFDGKSKAVTSRLLKEALLAEA